ncbi:MAG: S8 family serine peptidase [Chloroflexi bacterium]|nr:S8 family serine peptidase [Chloroflexota bacterium]
MHRTWIPTLNRVLCLAMLLALTAQAAPAVAQSSPQTLRQASPVASPSPQTARPAPSPASAGTPPANGEPIKPGTPSAAVPQRNVHPKMENNLVQITRAEKGEISAEQGRQYSLHFNEPVLVNIQANPTQGDQVDRLLKGLSIPALGRTRDVIGAEVPIRLLESLSQSSAVRYIERAYRGEPSNIDNDVITDILSKAWSDNGYKGTGVKIGILDGGFEDYSNAARGLTPIDGNHSCHQMSNTTMTDHGSMVAEVIKGIAPDVEIFVAAADITPQLVPAIDCFHTKGVKIINMSMGFPYASLEGPGNGDGVSGGSVFAFDYASSLGILVTHSIGNSGTRFWTGSWADTDLDGWLNFTDALGQPQGNSLTLSTSQWASPNGSIALRWRTTGTDGVAEWGDPCTNLDLHVGTGLFSRKSENSQFCVGGPSLLRPIELVNNASPNTTISVKWISGPDNVTLDLVAMGVSVNSFASGFGTAAGSFLHPADAKGSGVVVVGGLLKGGSDQLAAYSSAGPTTDGRSKPDIVTLTGLDVVGGPFIGTSASAPIVAAGAVLLLQSQPGLTGAQIAAVVKTNAVPVVTAEEYRVGNGRFRLLGLPPLSLSRVVFIGTSGSGLMARGGAGGASNWIHANAGNDLTKIDVVLAPSHMPHLMYIIGRTNGSPGTRKEYRSTDSGVTWTQIADSPLATNDVKIRPDADTRYAAAAGALWKSQGGGTWTQTALGTYTVPNHCLHRGITTGLHAFVLPTAPGSNRVWFRRAHATPNSNGSNCDQMLHYTDDEGASWWGGYGGWSSAGHSLVASPDPTRVYMGYSSGNLYRFDWTSQTSATGAQAGPFGLGAGNFASNTKNHALFYIPPPWSTTGHYISEDGGSTYTLVTGGFSPTLGMRYESAQPTNWWAASGTTIFSSTDNGASWTNSATGFSSALTSAVR